MSHIIKILSFLIIIAGISCEKTIEFNGGETNPKIVLYSNLQPDSIITCQIGFSYAIFEAKYTPSQIRNADVKLYKDNIFIESLSYTTPPVSDPDLYNDVQYLSNYESSNQIPEPLSNYKIEVAIPGYQSIYSSALLPEPVNITNIDTQLIVEKFDEYDYGMEPEWSYKNRILKTKISFTDPPNEENFYRLVVRQNYGFYTGDKNLPYNIEIPVLLSNNNISWIESDDPLLNPAEDEDILGSYTGNEYNIFSDEKISGKEYELSFDLNFNGDYVDTIYHEFTHFTIQLQSISKDLYYYLISYSSYKMTDGNFFSEPVLVYSNVENGLGIFGAFNSAKRSIKFGEYPKEGVYYEDEDKFWANYYP